jgi:carbon-monoxide dehydrogenase large subunit
VQAADAGSLNDPWREPPAAFDALEVKRGQADGGVEV